MKREAPTPDQLRRFASQFSEVEWDMLCDDPYFSGCVLDDMAHAATLASQVLRRTVFFILNKPMPKARLQRVPLLRR
jgi:hypothetical protein